MTRSTYAIAGYSIYWKFPTSVERLACAVQANELYRFALQEDTGVIYFLASITPVWTVVGNVAYEPTITAGVASQFWRGDKTWTDFDTTVRAALLTGIDITTKGNVSAADNILAAIGKLQATKGRVGPAFYAYVDTSHSISNGVFTKILLDAEAFDTDNCFASYKFTPNVAGYYLFICSAYISGYAATVENAMYVYRNGGAAVADRFGMHDVVMKVLAMSGVAIVHLNGSTDYVELYVYQDGGAQTVNRDQTLSYMAGFLVKAD